MEIKNTQEEWVSGFSRAAFWFPGLFLLRGKQFIYATIIIVGTALVYRFFLHDIFLISIFFLIIRIIVGFKGRKLVFDKKNQPLDTFILAYKKVSRRLKEIAGILLGFLVLWILAAALLPKISDAKGSANDLTRRTALTQVATALIAYNLDRNSYPIYGGCLSDIAENLLSVGLHKIPKDPNPSTTVADMFNLCTTIGEYIYIPIIQNGIKNGGFVLVTKTETEGGSNRVSDGTIGVITPESRYEDIKLCTSFSGTVEGTISNNGTGLCIYNTKIGQLRYLSLSPQL